MKKAIVIALLFASPNVLGACFFSHERVSGLNRLCFYNCIEGQRSITISATSMCPLQLYSASAHFLLKRTHEHNPAVGFVQVDNPGVGLLVNRGAACREGGKIAPSGPIGLNIGRS